MTKRNVDQVTHKLTVTLKDNRGEDIIFAYEGGNVNNFIESIGKLTQTFDTRDNGNKTPKLDDKKFNKGFEYKNKAQELFEDILEVENLSKIEKMKLLIRSTYKYGWFSAKDIYSLYQEYLGDIPSSTISTYLARLHNDGVLNRRGSKRDLEYMLNSQHLKTIPEYKFTIENNILQMKRVE